MIIRLAIVLAIWIGIALIHFRICKKNLWLKYDTQCHEYGSEVAHLPTNKDLWDEQYESGGPMILMPGVNILILIGSWVSYMKAKCEYNEKYRQSELWDNKPLKR